MLRGNLHAYMDMIRHQVAFNDPAFLLTGQCMEDAPSGFPKAAIHGLPAPLGDKHDGVLAIPPRMRQALIGVRHGVLLRCALIRPPEEYSTPGSLKALHVSLVKPVAYLKDRVMLLVKPMADVSPINANFKASIRPWPKVPVAGITFHKALLFLTQLGFSTRGHLEGVRAHCFDVSCDLKRQKVFEGIQAHAVGHQG